MWPSITNTGDDFLAVAFTPREVVWTGGPPEARKERNEGVHGSIACARWGGYVALNSDSIALVHGRKPSWAKDVLVLMESPFIVLCLFPDAW